MPQLHVYTCTWGMLTMPPNYCTIPMTSSLILRSTTRNHHLRSVDVITMTMAIVIRYTLHMYSNMYECLISLEAVYVCLYAFFNER